MPPLPQLEEAAHQPKAESRHLVGPQCCKLWRHLDAIHCQHYGLEAVTQSSLDRIIEQLQFCIVDARTMQLKMLERILSIALLEAYDSKEKSSQERENSRFQ
jgi:hypothetical protein